MVQTPAGTMVGAVTLISLLLISGVSARLDKDIDLPSESVPLPTKAEDLEVELQKSHDVAVNASTDGSNELFEYAYSERQYAASGWFTSKPVLSTHVESSRMEEVIKNRLSAHWPLIVSAYTVTYPRPFVYYNIYWGVNAKSYKWKLSYNEDGYAFQNTINQMVNSGYQAYQVDSYAFASGGTIYYTAIWFQKSYWPSGTKFEIGFGIPNDGSYCCSGSSRWIRLRDAGYKPVSFSITEDPVTKRQYIADVWNTVDVGRWQGGMAKTAAQLGQVLGSLDNMSPVYLKAYRVTDSYSGRSTTLYTYLAKEFSAPEYTLTTDLSNTGFSAMSKLLKKPPAAFTSFSSDCMVEPDQPGYGGAYTAIWEGVTTNM
eukprot:TRINITY_DN21067_c0_g1_i1.p1 TRINITY_DN21067_c0_g1~~TRINITY_DN21067_c0_g1_i1.p1  ORF type:complete len:371 (-),score=45.75 TRINITY_DN21067_c0_g1_i1:1168-2280(-)